MAGSVIPVRLGAPARSNVLLVAEALREAIVEGRLGAGERIKEIPLAKQLGVSRGPIRDALRLLERDGLIAVVPNRGAFVPAVHADDLLEVYAIRATLGSLAVHKVIVTDDATSDRRLEQAVRGLRRAVERTDGAATARADLAFQTTLVESTQMPRLVAEFERLTWQVRMFIATLDINYGDKLLTIAEEIEQLHEAVVTRQAKRADVLWRRKAERWVRDAIDRLPGDERFDADLWLALTVGPR